jgi:predicted amidohydrolase YtcJ
MRKLLLAAATIALTTPAHADTLVDNVDGLTIDATGGIERFTGLLVGDDGRIVQVLQRGDKRPGKVDYFLDGKGQVMVPGMIDSHGHVMGLGFSALTLDLTDTKSLAEALTKVAAYATANPDRPWILGRGWNQELWPEKRFPTAAELDAVAPDRPVWLERVDGHAGWANSKALAAANVTALTKAPAGGSIERLASGKPAGVLVDNATELVARAVPAPRPEDRDLALAKAQEILLARGVTAIADMGTTIEDWQAFRRAGDNGVLRMRIMSYAGGTENMALIGGPGPSSWLYDDKLRLNGVKLYSDGALGSRGASLKAPYSDAPTVKGLRVTGDTQLKNFISRAALDRFQVAIHAIGDEANAAALSAIEDMNQTYGGDRRWRIEHAQILDPADIPRFAKAGVIASMQPVHQTSDRLMAEARLGPTRLAGAYAWSSLSASGAKLAFGSDVPVELADPWAGLAAAISRVGPDGQPLGGWQPQERVSRELALAAYTANGAWAGFAEGRFGRLQRGERADFLLIDRDPMLATPADIRATQVLQVWVGGRLVHQRVTN